MSSFEKEIEDNLWDGMTDSWSMKRRDRIKSNRMLEHDSSALICALKGIAQDHAIDFICNYVDHEMNPFYRYFFSPANNASVSHLLRSDRFDGSGRCSIQPDILVCRIDSFDVVEIVVAIELKKSAQVNYVRCPSGRHPVYSNQIICYADSCWLLDSVESSQISYVWLCKESSISIQDIERNALSGITEKDQKFGGTEKAYALQSHFLNTAWIRCSVEEFVLSFSNDAPILVEKINIWISS